MTEDYTQAADKYALPRGMGNMAALITVGKSFFGYDLKRDGLPEVVVRAYARIGPEGLVAIARLAHDVGHPRFEQAEALCEWGIEHYQGHVAVSGEDRAWSKEPFAQALGFASEGVWQPEWIARGHLMRSYVERTWGRQIAGIKGAPADWADWIDWTRTAEKEAEAGKVTFVQYEQQTHQDPPIWEVDMFEGKWEGATE